MIKHALQYLRFLLPSVFINKKKRNYENLERSFGQVKEETFDFELIEKYFKSNKHNNLQEVISDKTCNDLDLDDHFKFIDRTNSKVGQQYLYNQIRSGSYNEAQTALNENIIAQLQRDPKTRIYLQNLIQRLNHKDAYDICTLFNGQHIETPKWFFVIQFLSFASLISIILSFFSTTFLLVSLLIFSINFIIHYWNKGNLAQYVHSIPQLVKLNAVAGEIYRTPALQPLEPELNKAMQTINQVKNRMMFFQLEAKFQREYEIIGWFLFEMIKITFLLELFLLFGVLKRLNNKRREIESVFTFLGKVDMIISITSLRHGLKTHCIPNIQRELSIDATEMYHPLIPNCTPNSIHIRNKSILLTGSNMSGKTSFIRTVGLNVITGMTINTCFAQSMRFPRLSVSSAIRISDDLLNSKSYYFEEVLTIKDMIKRGQSSQYNLFLMDEIFKGTNTIERIAAGKAVLSALAKQNNLVMVSTHDVELTDMLDEQYDLYHFSETVENSNVGFDYKLKPGKLKTRNAIKILEINEYPSEIVQEANTIAIKLDQTHNPKP